MTTLWIFHFNDRKLQQVRKVHQLNIQFSEVKVYQFTTAAIIKYHQSGGLNNRNSLSHNSGGQKSKTICWQGWFLLRAVSENLCHTSCLPSDGLLAIFGIPWFVEVFPELCLCLHMVFSLCACLPLNFPFLYGHWSYWSRTHLNYLILTHLHMQRPYLQIRCNSEVLGVRTSTRNEVAQFNP